MRHSPPLIATPGAATCLRASSPGLRGKLPFLGHPPSVLASGWDWVTFFVLEPEQPPFVVDDEKLGPPGIERRVSRSAGERSTTGLQARGLQLCLFTYGAGAARNGAALISVLLCDILPTPYSYAWGSYLSSGFLPRPSRAATVPRAPSLGTGIGGGAG